MARDINELKQTLKDTIDAFNAGEMAEVQTHLANNIQVTSLGPRSGNPHARAETTNGSAAIHNEILDNAQFTNGKFNFEPPEGVVDEAKIKGTATWRDQRGTDPIEFEFDCVADDNQWFFRKVKASVVGGGN